ncbi:MAG: HD domain-containing protein [bacterium]|nr:HD domain-containing protein [bacterium]
MAKKDKLSLENLLDFVRFTHLFQKIARVVLVNGEERFENDAEHSYQLTLVAWYLLEYNKLNLEVNKVILLALTHDLVEAYAGDTYIYAKAEILARKKEREEEAIKLLRENFPEFSSLHDLIYEYEKRETSESKFVYALDKLLPVLNIYLDNGRTWQKERITLEQLLANKTAKVSLSPEIVPYYEELVSLLKRGKGLFSV